MNISAEPSAPPQTNVDEEMVEKIKVAMSDRYVPENKGRKREHMSYDSSIFTIHFSSVNVLYPVRPSSMDQKFEKINAR